MKWNDLTMKERSDLMSLFLKAGVGSLSDMKRIYEEYQPLEGTSPYKYPDGGNVYTVQPGDTLSGISQRFTGRASNYMDIAASNNIEDANKIYAGQKIVIPYKFDKPLKRAEITTDNNTVVIVTHNALIAEVADRVIRLKNGQIESNEVNKHPKNIDEVEW